MTRGRLFRIGFIGLGKLGMPCAEVFAEQHDVVGYDLCPRSSQSVRIARSFSEAVLDRDIIFVAVQTPHDPAYGGKAPIAKMPPKDFDYGHVKRVLQHLNKITSSEQLIVLISTVLPGTCREQFAPLLSNARLIYNPYLIAMGSVKWDLVNPEMIIVGTEDGSLQGEAENLYELYESLVRLPRYVLATWDEAECVKIFYNTFISMKIGIANMLQDVAEAVGNINVDVITDALKMANQRVISPRYLTAGMGDGGPCHPRDNIALRFLAQRLGLGYDMFQSIVESREGQALNMARFVVRTAESRGLPIVINGRAYKPGVPFIDGSYSVLVGHFIKQLGHSVIWVDPATGDRPTLDGPAVFLMAHNAEVAYPAGAKSLCMPTMYCVPPPESVVIDPWRQYSPTSGVDVIAYGNTRDRSVARTSDAALASR